jgi:hypothetical protein
MEQIDQAASKIGFLDLPPEVRLQVCSYCVPSNTIQMGTAPLVHGDQWGEYYTWTDCAGRDRDKSRPRHGADMRRFSSTPNWLRDSVGRRRLHSAFSALRVVCRTIREEVLEIFYATNLFVLTLVGYCPQTNSLSEPALAPPNSLSYCANGRRIRHIMLAVGGGWADWPNTETWDVVLPRLKTLWIITEKGPDFDEWLAEGVRGDIDLPTPEEFLKRRRKEWRDLHDWLSAKLSPDATVLFDFACKDEAKKISRKYRPRRRAFVRTTVRGFLYGEHVYYAAERRGKPRY